MKTPLEHLELALGGNMNIGTLRPKAFTEIMQDYAKHYHKEQLEKNEQIPRLTLDQAIEKAKPNMDKIKDVDAHLNEIK